MSINGINSAQSLMCQHVTVITVQVMSSVHMTLRSV